jgi:hypothetical protein
VVLAFRHLDDPSRVEGLDTRLLHEDDVAGWKTRVFSQGIQVARESTRILRALSGPRTQSEQEQDDEPTLFLPRAPALRSDDVAAITAGHSRVEPTTRGGSAPTTPETPPMDNRPMRRSLEATDPAIPTLNRSDVFVGSAELTTEPGVQNAPTVHAAGVRVPRHGRALGAHLAFLWRRLPPRKRQIVTVVMGGVGALVLCLLFVLFRPGGPVVKDRLPEPEQLSQVPTGGSFGWGEDVTWPRVDSKLFYFEITAPTRAVAVVHYEAQELSHDEVEVVLNGASQGMLPADAHAGRPREWVLRPADIRMGARNELLFDSVRNPPGEETWRIAGVALELIPIPDLPERELRENAHNFARQGQALLEQRDIGTDNLFRAWRSYRLSWLTMEALEEKPELYRRVREQLDRIRRELDRRCAEMMLTAQKALELRKRPKAKHVLTEVSRHFPTTEHPCHNRALEMLAENRL